MSDQQDRQYPHEKRPKSEIPTGVTRLPDPWPNYQGLLENYLSSRGLDPRVALENGWYLSDCAGDRYLRVVMPCTNTRGYAYWQARAIDATVLKRYQSPSYSSSDSLAVVWPGDNRRPMLAAIVEGPMDALAAAGVGVVGIATMGKQPSDEVLTHIMKLVGHYTLYIVPDKADTDAGASTALKLASRYSKYAMVKVPRAKDLAAMKPEERGWFFAEV